MISPLFTGILDPPNAPSKNLTLTPVAGVLRNASPVNVKVKSGDTFGSISGNSPSRV